MQQLINEIQATLRRSGFMNETHIRTGIVDPILSNLGWSASSGNSAPEYRLESGWVDIALLDARREPAVFIEIKQPGKDAGAVEQLRRYSAEIGVDIAVITTGRSWRFFLPSGKGKFIDREFCSLDLVTNSPAQSEELLTKYLDHDLIHSGVATNNAIQTLYETVAIRRLREDVPRILNEMVRTSDSTLVGILADRVSQDAKFDGYELEIADILKNYRSSQFGHESAVRRAGQGSSVDEGSLNRTGSRTVVTGFRLQESKTNSRSTTISKVTIFGIEHETPLGTRQALKTVLLELASRDHSFLDRLSSAYPSLLSSSRLDFVDPITGKMKPAVQQLAPDSIWWLRINLSSDGIVNRIKQACRVANVNIGEDVVLELV